MFAIVVITSTLAGMALFSMLANPRPDHPVRVVGRACGRIIVAWGMSYARVRFPWAMIDEDTQYSAWLESHRDTRQIDGPGTGAQC